MRPPRRMRAATCAPISAAASSPQHDVGSAGGDVAERQQDVAGQQARRWPPVRPARSNAAPRPSACRDRPRRRRGAAAPRVSTPTPSQARCTPPWRRISLTTKRTVLLATAKQMPCAPRIIAVLMPMTAPADETSAPPELPGLSAASVWITSSIGRPLRDASERPSAETTPAVTVELKPSGLPIATAIWPRLSVAAVAEHGRRQAGAMRLEQREVGVGVGAEQFGASSCGRRERRLRARSRRR